MSSVFLFKDFLSNLLLKIIIYCVNNQPGPTFHNSISKMCPKFQVLRSQFSDVNDVQKTVAHAEGFPTLVPLTVDQSKNKKIGWRQLLGRSLTRNNMQQPWSILKLLLLCSIITIIKYCDPQGILGRWIGTEQGQDISICWNPTIPTYLDRVYLAKHLAAFSLLLRSWIMTMISYHDNRWSWWCIIVCNNM